MSAVCGMYKDVCLWSYSSFAIILNSHASQDNANVSGRALKGSDSV